MNRLSLNVMSGRGRMHEDMDRFLGLGCTSHRGFPFSRVSFRSDRSTQSWPLLNISEDTDNIYVDALAPGLNAESLDVSMIGDQLTISGERKTLPEGMAAEMVRRTERSGGSFRRTVTLPGEVDNGRIEARYKSGLLKITLPKAEAAKPKKIQVNVS